MKVKLNPMFEEARGHLGDLVFREIRGETVASRKPTLSGGLTENQLEHRERFKQAAVYGKSALADADTRALYEAAAKSKNIPVFALTIADFFNAPTIHSVDLSTYSGQIDSIIKITASDDFGVQKVHVSITNEQGGPIESGYAMETAEGTGLWVYVAVTSIESNNVVVTAVATDRPGGTAVRTVTKNF